MSVFSLQSMPKAFAIEPVNKSAKQTSARGLNLSAQPTDKLQLAHANSKQGRIASRVASLSIGVVDRLRVRFASSTSVILHKSKANALRIPNRTWQMENLKVMRNSKPDRRHQGCNTALKGWRVRRSTEINCLDNRRQPKIPLCNIQSIFAL